MSDKILVIDDFIPDEVCKQMCELFDESTEDGGQRTYMRGDNLHCIQLNMQRMMGMKAKSSWVSVTKQFAKAIRTGYAKWCKETDTKPADRISLEAPMFHRYDPEFGIHNSTVFKKIRLVTVHFYLNDVQGGNLLFPKITSGKSKKPVQIAPKKGRAVIFPATEEYTFEEKAPKKYLKYVVKGHTFSS